MRILGLLQLTWLLYYVCVYNLEATITESNGPIFAHTINTSTLYPLGWASAITNTDTDADTDTDTDMDTNNDTNTDTKY